MAGIHRPNRVVFVKLGKAHPLLPLILLAEALSAEMPPVDIYKRAVVAMHAIQGPAYLQFDTRVTSKLRGGRGAVILQHIRHVERTSDLNDIAQDVDEDIDPRATPFEIAPDLFLGRPAQNAPASNSEALTSGLDDLTDKPLKTIAVVSVTRINYNVTTVGTEDIPNCASSIHLKLEPQRDPLIYNLRDLWIDTATSRMCKAVAVWRGHVGAVRVLAPITLNIDGNGFINHFSTLVSARFLVGAMSIQQDASYDHLQAVDKSVWSAADIKQKASDGKP